jgi:hypothetical protein
MNNINKYIFEFEDGNIIIIQGNTFHYTKLINDPNNDVLIEAAELSVVGKLRKVSIQ